MVNRSNIGRSYGWKPQLPDIRDRKWQSPYPQGHLLALSPSTSIDYRNMMPPVYDQGKTSSCTAQAGAATIQYEMKRLGFPDWTPSRLFIYWNERYDDGDTGKDEGATIRESMKALNTYGFVSEDDWPFDITKLYTAPPQSLYPLAKKNLVTQYEAVNQDLDSIRSVLQAGLLINFGVSVYTSFESDSVSYSGIIPLPNPKTEKMLGGHALVIVGDDPPTNSFIIRNSWGVQWGMNGYCLLPYLYVMSPDLADDFWAIQLIQESA